jgi:hypothetical protein
MSNWRNNKLQVLRSRISTDFTFLLLAFVTILTLANLSKAQSSTGSFPGPAVREGNRSMDDYDRTINRMKNDAKATNERRRNLFPQIDDDFKRIQVIHNELARMIQQDKVLNYGRLAELTDDMKKRSSRLRENLLLPEPEGTKSQHLHNEPIDEGNVTENIFALHAVVVRFVANPIFKNLGVVDAKVIESASDGLHDIITLSEEIKREAKILSKSSK